VSEPVTGSPLDVPPEPLGARRRAEVLRGDAVELLEKGAYEEALAVYDEALAASRETDDPAFVDWIYVCRAAASTKVAKVRPADDELVELKRILLRAADPQTAFRAAYTGASIYEVRRDYKKGLFYNRIARQKAEQTGDALLVVGSENQLGNLLVADSRFEEAALAYERALAAGDGISEVFRAVTRDNLGYCRLATDHLAEGLQIVHEAFDLLEREGASSFTVLPLLDLCFGYLKSDRFVEARYFGEAGLARCAEDGDPNDPHVVKNFLYLLGESCHLGGDLPAAQGYFDRLAALYPEFRNLRAYLEVFDFRNVINLRS
jgi:tetratricopeptide (TPR) repeat protein